MRNLPVAALTTLVASLVAVPEAFAVHGPGGGTRRVPANGFPWEVVLLWGGIAVVSVLLVGWIVRTARRHDWHPRPAAHA